jgi:hypothetical protein
MDETATTQEQKDTAAQESQSQETPTKSQQETVLTEEQKAINEFKRKEELYLATIREQGQELNKLNSRVTQVEEKIPAPVEVSSEDRAKKFYQDPQKAIDEAVERAVAPLKDFVRSFKSESQYDRLKTRFKSDDRFKQVFEQYESYIDEAMSKNEPTEGNMIGVLSGVVGAARLGFLKGAPPVNDTKEKEREVFTPPHIRPSHTRPPESRDEKPKTRELTENERRLAREKGQSPEEYIAWLDEPKDRVAVSKIGKEAKK